ncbi:MAG: phosphoenolpyruvate mutase [Candidatus Methanomethylophilaceae archaeon]|nr:phosphoenolpyruvate mutase [Candidatus Methanomethylophilaceae archaeon]
MSGDLVYVTMVGDVVHPGNLNIISEASKRGEVMVGLLTDKAIVMREHPPYLDYEKREIIIRNIKGVSKVVPQDDWCGEDNLRRYRPRYVVHGDDWVSNSLSTVRARTIEVLAEWGGEVVDIPYTHGINASVVNTARREFGTTPELRLIALRRLVESKPLIRVMEVHSGISGLIVEHAEIEKEDGLHYFDAMWSSSLTDSTSKGKPDIEAVDLTTRMQNLSNILECTTKPIIYDGDTGGKPEHFVFTVRTLERNGISAVIIEDKVGLKRNSLYGTSVEQTLAPVQDFCDKIHAGKAAQITKEFMIIARLESLIAGHSVDEAMERARAYISAGADGIMIHSKEKSGRDIKEFCQKFRLEYPKVPLVLVPTTYNQYKESELAEWGANIVIYANHMLRAAYPAMVKVANCILENERSLEANDLCMPIKDILGLIPEPR